MVTSTKCSSRCTGDMAIGIQGDDTAGSKIKYKNQRKTQDFLTSRDKYRCLSTSRSMIRPMNLQSFGEAEPPGLVMQRELETLGRGTTSQDSYVTRKAADVAV